VSKKTILNVRFRIVDPCIKNYGYKISTSIIVAIFINIIIIILTIHLHMKSSIQHYRFKHLNLLLILPSRSVITSTWWEGLVLPMIPRAMPAELKLLAGPPKPVRSRKREEAKNNPRRRELR
jgi:hypothetical protein